MRLHPATLDHGMVYLSLESLGPSKALSYASQILHMKITWIA